MTLPSTEISRARLIEVIEVALTQHTLLVEEERERLRKVAREAEYVARGRSSWLGIGCPLKQASLWEEQKGGVAMGFYATFDDLTRPEFVEGDERHLLRVVD